MSHYNGKSCKYGHTIRYVVSGRCVQCARNRAIVWQKDNFEKHKRHKQRTAGLPEPTRPKPDVCEACGQSERKIHYLTGKPQSLSLDHDHRTGKFRGWLCNDCNGSLRDVDNPVEWLTALLDYVRPHVPQ